MDTARQAADDFLAQKRIAVVGVSRNPGQAANIVYKKLRDSDCEVFAVNPKADEVEGDRCYPTLAAIEGGVDAAVIATHPDVTSDVVRDCAANGVRRVWMHRSFGTGSVSEEAVALCHQHGIDVIAGGCPMMYVGDADLGHRCMRWILEKMGKLPEPAGQLAVSGQE
jgi:predicted CoA-binding protein